MLYLPFKTIFSYFIPPMKSKLQHFNMTVHTSDKGEKARKRQVKFSYIIFYVLAANSY